jgi:exopolysaccharide biosynthesis polyprenyl glycosylphosphotransferase
VVVVGRARGAFAVTAMVAVPVVLLVLLLVARAGLHHRWRSPHRVVIVGGGSLARKLVAEIEARPQLGQKIVGLVDDGPEPDGTGVRRLGRLADLARIVDEMDAQRVVVALASRRGRTPLRALLELRLRGILVEDGVDVYERLTGKIAIEALTPSSLIFSRAYRARLDLAVARYLSLPLVAAALVFLSPLLALVALAIKLESRGPLFFIQERVGRGGRPFELIKFRTMRPAPAATSEWARDNDGRVTRVGRWLRRFRLDELPQLVNILKGDMNLVGPRPHPATNVPLFVVMMRNAPECGEQVPYYALRSLVRPGVTGWAQVRYRYANDLEEEVEKMRHDLYYIKRMCVWLDVRILFETVKIVLRGHQPQIGAEVAPVAAPRARTMPRAMTAATARPLEDLT